MFRCLRIDRSPVASRPLRGATVVARRARARGKPAARREMVSTIRDRDGLIATRRTLLARAQITPGNGELLCLWAGCADVDWQRSEEPLLRKIVETFEVL